MPRGLALATPQLTSDGTPFSAQYDDVYHSTEGGLAQAHHVFLGGNRLPGAWQGKSTFTIVETGFGQGLNFLATWAAWRDDPQHCARLDFVSIENKKKKFVQELAQTVANNTEHAIPNDILDSRDS